MQNQRCEEQSHHYMSKVKFISKGLNFSFKAKNIYRWYSFKGRSYEKKRALCIYLSSDLTMLHLELKCFLRLISETFFTNVCSLLIVFQRVVKSLGVILSWGLLCATSEGDVHLRNSRGTWFVGKRQHFFVGSIQVTDVFSPSPARPETAYAQWGRW